MEENKKDFVSENQSEESFEELLNQSSFESTRFNPGEKVDAVITHTAREWVFIDLGGKSEGCIEKDEFLDDEGNITVKEGDTISAYFLSRKNNNMLFTTRLTSGSAGDQFLEEAYHNRIPIEGFVEKEIKGGFQVKIPGNIHAFCPYSQMGLHRIENTDQYLGQHLTFHIIEYDKKGRNIIISHRAILEEERQKQKEILKETLQEGTSISGHITSIRKFGAFVDIGGIEGLIPVSEISWGRVEDINHSLSVGQKVNIVIKKLDWENDKFSFSLKETLPDPWENIGVKYPEGSSHKGKVDRLTTFGAFVTLEPGIDGLIHISELGKGKRINHPREVLDVGQTVKVKILKMDQRGKRLALAMSSDEPDLGEDDYYNDHIASTENASSGSFGTLGDILRDKMKKK
ncbi:MAG: 30S ribosomal protein S1 [Thermodesulfobacteriota bacterium]|nr:30S ribosomal protein S1 [Thermodesulfobacteriota bacterium]